MNASSDGIETLHQYSFGRSHKGRTLIIGADRKSRALRRWAFLAGVAVLAAGIGVYTGRQQDGATLPSPAGPPAPLQESAAPAASIVAETAPAADGARPLGAPSFHHAPDSVLEGAARSFALLDPAALSGAPPRALAESAPLAADLKAVALPEPAMIIASVPEQEADEGEAEAPIVQVPPRRDEVADEPAIPLPMPRPSELRMARGADPVRPPTAILPRQAKAAPSTPATAAPSSEPSFFAKIFGAPKPEGQVMAYAAPQDDAVDPLRGRPAVAAPAPAPAAGGGVAVYDIAARTVTMPSGEKLEAHSGLGPMLDDPRYVSQRMRGPTPPHTYDLSLRESLFHGVQAIRLNPIGGSGAIHGRAGLLAHTFMLGPKGDSNGCISFRDYERFLQAYLRGEVKRLVVVAGRG